MSKVVDQKVVEMQFDNRHFERNVATSMSTLEKLKQSLKLPDASKSLDGINKAAKNVNLSGIGNAVDTVQTKFSALQVAGVTALANITNSAVNYGKRIVKSLTIDPVTTGFNEYELKMGSIQTIMAGTGESLDRVNQKLNELNKYSDDTIYSFKDMTDNIGKFTNAGVKLDDAVDAIKGISNVAAISGASANEASRAMYNFSQALSAGYVQLIDWKSIELANMGTAEFRQQLIDAAVATGQLTKESEGLYKTLEGNEVTVESFRNTLQDKWLTSDVLIKTLKNYADGTTEIGEKATKAATEVKTFSMMMDTLKESVQSGWAQTWEIVVGDFEEAKEIFTKLSNFLGGIIEKISNARNDLLGGVLSSPWENISKKIEASGINLDEFKNKLKKTAKAHNKELQKMSDEELDFDKMLKDGIVTKELVIETLKDYVGNLGGMGESTDDMSDKLNKFQKIVDQVWHGDFGNGEKRIKALTEAGYDYAEVQDLVNKTVDGHRLTLEDLSEEQLKSIGYTDEQIKSIKALADEAEKADTPLSTLLDRMNKKSGRELIFESFTHILGEFEKILDAVSEAWDEAFGDVNLTDVLYTLIEKFHDLALEMEITEDSAENFKKVFEGLFAAFQISNMMISATFTAGLKIAAAILELFDTNLVEVAAHIAEYIIKLRDWIEEHTIFIDTYNKIAKVVKVFIDGIRQCVDAIMSLQGVKDVIKKFTDKFNQLFGSINEGIDALGIDAFCAKLEAAFTSVRNWIEALNDSENLGKDLIDGLVNGLKAGVQKVVTVISDLGQKIIDTICKVLGINSPSKVFFAIGGFIIAGLIAGLLSNYPDVLESLKTFGAQCIEVIKNINFGQVFAAAISVGMLLLVRKILNIIDKLVNPIEGFGKLMSSLSGMFGDIGEAQKIKANAAKWTAISKIILSVAVAIAAITAAMYILGNMENKELLRAGIALTAMVGIIALIMVLATMMSKIQGVGKSFKSVIVIAGSLLILSIAMAKLTEIDVDAVPAALKAMGVMVLGIAGVLAAFGLFTSGDKAKYLNRAGTMIIKMTVALLLMTGVLKVVSLLSDDEINRGLITITKMAALFAAIIAVSALPGKSVSKVGAMILKMSVALLLMVGVIKLAAMLDASTVESGLKVIAQVALLFAAIVAVSALAGPNASKAGIMILAMAGAFGIMVYVIKKASELDETTVDQGIGVIGKVAILFAGLIAVSELAGPNAMKAGIMLLAMAGAMAILTGVMYVMSKMDSKGLGRALIAVTTLGAMFAVLIGVTSMAKDCKATLIVLTVAITMLVVAITALSFIDPDKLGAATLALSLVIGMLALVITATKNVGQATGTLIAMSVAIGVIGGVLYLLGGLPVESSLGAAASLSVLMVVLAGVLRIIEGLQGPSAMALVAIGVLSGVMYVLGLVLKSLQDLDPVQGIAIVGVLSAFLAALLIAIGVMQVLHGPSVMALAALGIITLVVAALAGVLYALRDVDPTQAMGMVTAIGVFLGVMLGVCAAASLVGMAASVAIPGLAILVTFIGVLGLVLIGLAELAMDVLDGMPKLGSDLSGFMTNVKPFIDGIQTVPENIVDKVSDLCKAIGKLTTRELLDSIKSFFSGGDSLADMGAELKKFGECVGSFTDNVSSTSVDAIIASITELVNLDFSSSEANISNFKESMEDLASDAVDSFADELSSSDSKKKAKDGVKVVIEAAGEQAESKSGYNAFYDAGEALVDGLAAGIKANKSTATSAAQNVADAVEAIIRAAWKVNSPSKVFYDIALGIGEGMSYGIKDSGNDVINSADVLADKARKGLGGALARINTLINDSMDVQPTISPVLDLTNVKSGVGTLNGILSTSSIGVNANIGAISTMMGRRSQNGVNGDVVYAIDKLRKDLGRVGNSTYNINGITYDDGSNVSDAVRVLVRAAKIERRV